MTGQFSSTLSLTHYDYTGCVGESDLKNCIIEFQTCNYFCVIDSVCHLRERLVRSEVWPSLKGINWGQEFLEGLFTFQNLAKLNISCHHFTSAYQIEVKRIWRHNLDVLKKKQNISLSKYPGNQFMWSGENFLN